MTQTTDQAPRKRVSRKERMAHIVVRIPHALDAYYSRGDNKSAAIRAALEDYARQHPVDT